VKEGHFYGLLFMLGAKLFQLIKFNNKIYIRLIYNNDQFANLQKGTQKC
jgi:hypothetical protein